MPSVSNSSKVEKSSDVQEPQSKVQLLIENKIRNLEKRKSRLEQLEEERKSGKELNADQRKALKKYEEVAEMLEFFKEFKKNVQSIFAEHSKQLKEEAKKEHRQRHLKELERLKSIILFQDVLLSISNENARIDFLNGSNGAITITQEKLNHLDELSKLVHLDRTRADLTITKQISKAAERLLSLVDPPPSGKKESELVKGVTYEELKETLISIHDCGYFDLTAKKVTPSTNLVTISNKSASSLTTAPNKNHQPDNVSTAGAPRASESQPISTFESKHLQTSQQSNIVSRDTQQQRSNEIDQSHVKHFTQGKLRGNNSNQPNMNNMGSHGGSSGQSNASSSYNFLQESRLEGAPHMDPAVVAMGPVPSFTTGYTNNQAQAVEALAAQLSGIPMSSASTMSKANYDTSGAHQPIPTQTFTNQRFTAMMAGGFVQPVHPSMVPGSSYNVPGLAVSFPGQAMPSIHTTSSDHQQQQQQQHHQKPQYSGLNDPNMGNQTTIGGALTSQSMTGYESESFTQFKSQPETNRSNQAPSRDKQNYHDESSGFASHYGQYRPRNNRGGGLGHRGLPNQGNLRGGNKTYHPTNGYSRNANSGRPGQAGKPRPQNKYNTQDPRNATGSSMVWSSS